MGSCLMSQIPNFQFSNFEGLTEFHTAAASKFGTAMKILYLCSVGRKQNLGAVLRQKIAGINSRNCAH